MIRRAWLLCGPALFLFLVVTLPIQAEAPNDIEQLYSKTYKAAALKYRYGMHSHRTEKFKGYDANGLVSDPKAEAQWLDTFLKQALWVKESGKILSFRWVDEATVDCEVLDSIEATVVSDVLTGERKHTVLTTKSLDRWVRRDETWRQESCRLLEQSYQEKPVAP